MYVILLEYNRENIYYILIQTQWEFIDSLNILKVQVLSIGSVDSPLGICLFRFTGPFVSCILV